MHDLARIGGRIARFPGDSPPAQRACLCVVLLAAGLAPSARALTPQTAELADLSLEELTQIQVMSVSRRAERLVDAAASIFVITHEDIRRSSAKTLPEALRLAPNLQVARVNAASYAISARGFNNSLGNKLLVLIDGRIVYTPLFSGVFWDSQEVLLQDIERIEVISGPGATLWGANAVNGVINVITRPAAQTQGGMVSVAAGNAQRAVAVRYGGQVKGVDVRLYAKGIRLDNTTDARHAPQPDAWDSVAAGFRADWRGAEAEMTLQGDVYRGQSEMRTLGPIEVAGANVLARWSRETASGARWRVQGYVDRIERDDPLLFHDRMTIADLEFQHDVPFHRHHIVWGADIGRHATGYRKVCWPRSCPTSVRCGEAICSCRTK
ncbi:TonB-dependent receptor plug domain-containing protein [Tahibacter amnicola]|uniref:TonB-dependent receptor plug domain-containing protein n=1 Tax=Tahibacter amnicola TaxID=2976241 RepID=A0ABY6BAE5_9GAMM|nr:TonB-dependent receptor plug domain-containing protein [Tahibacter amnicola]UXI66767.1 TonB-dependent receptor plug domain-containing protein [Tahibacter amnicola]